MLAHFRVVMVDLNAPVPFKRGRSNVIDFAVTDETIIFSLRQSSAWCKDLQPGTSVRRVSAPRNRPASS